MRGSMGFVVWVAVSALTWAEAYRQTRTALSGIRCCVNGDGGGPRKSGGV